MSPAVQQSLSVDEAAAYMQWQAAEADFAQDAAAMFAQDDPRQMQQAITDAEEGLSDPGFGCFAFH